jgi:predicted peptidase
LIQNGQWPTSRPFVVLSPQEASAGCPSGDEVHNFISFAVTQYNVDPARIYLTGISCGAAGIIFYLQQYGNDRLAAVVPIAADPTPAWDQGCSLVNDMALWQIQGELDPYADVNQTNQIMSNFMNCPQPRKDVRYTVYPGVGHESWPMTYDLSAGNDIYAWMLDQHR